MPKQAEAQKLKPVFNKNTNKATDLACPTFGLGGQGRLWANLVDMETETALNTRILHVTLQLQEHYPELYRNLNEMHATLPIVGKPVINARVLGKWCESLQLLIKQYDSVSRK